MEPDSVEQEKKPRIIPSPQQEPAPQSLRRPRVVNPIVSGIVPPDDDATTQNGAFGGQSDSPEPVTAQAAFKQPETAGPQPSSEKQVSADVSGGGSAEYPPAAPTLPQQPSSTSPQVRSEALAQLALQDPKEQRTIAAQKPRVLQISARKPLEPEDVLEAGLLTSPSDSIGQVGDTTPAVSTGGGKPSRDDPDSAASWAQEALTEAEKDAYASSSLGESLMADDIIRRQATRDMTPVSSFPPAPFEAAAPPAAGPKSVGGVAYSVRGLFEGIKKKLMGI